MKWINVKDRLPDKGVDILVYCGWVISGIFDGEMTFYTEDGVNPVYHVTHWQYMPEPPKDE